MSAIVSSPTSDQSIGTGGLSGGVSSGRKEGLAQLFDFISGKKGTRALEPGIMSCVAAGNLPCHFPALTDFLNLPSGVRNA